MVNNKSNGFIGIRIWEYDRAKRASGLCLPAMPPAGKPERSIGGLLSPDPLASVVKLPSPDIACYIIPINPLKGLLYPHLQFYQSPDASSQDLPGGRE